MDAKNEVQKVLEHLLEQNGEITPSALVAEARPETSPIHTAFEWDDVKAGDQYRLWQARQWIRRVEVIIEDRPERLIHVPNIQNAASEGFYKPMSMVVRHTVEYKAALNETLARLNAARHAYDSLKMSNTINLNFEKADHGFQMVEEALTA